MQFDPENPVVKLCGEGMNLEGAGKQKEAHLLFHRALNEAQNDFEKCIAAHYFARNKETVSDKLLWDEITLLLALRVKDQDMQDFYPSLYLNIGKCFEDLNEPEKALQNYSLALSFADKLPEEGYGKMIRSGILAGIERITSSGTPIPTLSPMGKGL